MFAFNPRRVAVLVWERVCGSEQLRGGERGPRVYFMRSGCVVLWEVGVRGVCGPSLSRGSLRT